MKPQLLKISSLPDYSFNLFVQDSPYFGTPWHYHPEYEIVLVEESIGKRFIGSHVSDFKPGNLCMIGAYLPHYYRNEDKYYDKNSNLRARSFVIHFLEDFMGEKFMNLPECQQLKSLLERSKAGLDFGSKTVKKVAPLIRNLNNLTSINRLMELIDILTILAESDDVQELTTNPIYMENEVDSNRISGVYTFVMQNYQKDIDLGRVAKMVNMSESAFSRYFKKRTRRTFSQFVTEIRIEHACKLLTKDNMSISGVSEESGFNNLSNFNRQFKLIKGTTPLAYRNSYLK